MNTNKEKYNINAMNLLMSSNQLSAAAWKTERAGVHVEVVIGIGDDHIAYLTMDAEAYIKLQSLKVTEHIKLINK